MADPTTELAKEFLEMNDYLVRKETKFQKSKKLQGTPSDIDIVAISPKGIQKDGLQLSENIIGEVKNWRIEDKDTLDDIYEDKFKFIDAQPKAAWKQLRKLIPSKRYDKVIFCLATTQQVYDYAWKKYGIKIVTTGLMIKLMTKFFKESERKWTFYPERYNYNTIRSIMHYLYQCYKWKDKLTLEDLVWIDPEAEPRYRNQFVEMNSKFLEDLVYFQSSCLVLTNLINRAANDDPQWLKSILKSNKKFWNHLKSK
jgi:hypothetical protein